MNEISMNHDDDEESTEDLLSAFKKGKPVDIITPVGWRCPEGHMTTSGGIAINHAPRCYCLRDMEPMWPENK